MILNEEKMLKIAGLLKEAEDNSDDLKKYVKSEYIRVYKYSDPNMGYGDGGTRGLFKVNSTWFEMGRGMSFGPYVILVDAANKELKKYIKGYNTIDYGWTFITASEYNSYLKSMKQEIDSLNDIIKNASKSAQKF